MIIIKLTHSLTFQLFNYNIFYDIMCNFVNSEVNKKMFKNVIILFLQEKWLKFADCFVHKHFKIQDTETCRISSADWPVTERKVYITAYTHSRTRQLRALFFFKFIFYGRRLCSPLESKNGLTIIKKDKSTINT